MISAIRGRQLGWSLIEVNAEYAQGLMVSGGILLMYDSREWGSEIGAFKVPAD